jgi:hypothetical protein
MSFIDAHGFPAGHYTSREFAVFSANNGVTRSMGRRATCFHNAVSGQPPPFSARNGSPTRANMTKVRGRRWGTRTPTIGPATDIAQAVMTGGACRRFGCPGWADIEDRGVRGLRTSATVVPGAVVV